MDDAEWRMLAELIESRFGLAFRGVRREILESRLNPRLTALNLQSFFEYYRYLRYHPERDVELDELVRRTTNNETYFFREPHHFEIIAQHIVPELGAVLRERPLRVLSAGCSSGEEPYSLVITLQNAGIELGGVRWEVDAIDLNAARLEQARRAEYEQTSLRACDEETRARYFTTREGRYILRERYRKGTRFFAANLAAPFVAPEWNLYDAILCRNLLIYFSDSAFSHAIEFFARLLPPGGYLMLGHSESLLDRSPAFAPVVVNGIVVYRRTGTN